MSKKADAENRSISHHEIREYGEDIHGCRGVSSEGAKVGLSISNRAQSSIAGLSHGFSKSPLFGRFPLGTSHTMRGASHIFMPLFADMP
jgi:hypothetical protein